MKIGIVTHCYAVELPHYAACLHYQLNSLQLRPAKTVETIVSVCYTSDDGATCRVLDYFNRLGQDLRFQLRRLAHPLTELGRRSIGRNRAALATQADLVWFTDVDHVFCDDVLDRLAAFEWPDGASMIFPRTIKIHQDHATGDKALADTTRPFDPSEFIDKHYSRAIGGVQIVQGDFARKYGYLNGDNQWRQPAEKPFGDFRDDVAYRHLCQQHGPIVGIDLPGVYRIRHSTTSYQ